MPKKKLTLEDLCQLAGKLNLPAGALDDELWDACEASVRLQHENVTSSSLYEQLEFLHLSGYALGRLKELIEEAAREN
jgi:hypothetical protein